MKGVQIWQHPFVDVFKYCNVSEWRLSHKEGDVTEGVDKALGKKVFKLQGSVSASNYIQLPKPRSEMKSLGLNGKYIYLSLFVLPGKLFSLHLDLTVFNTRTNLEEPLKVSLSNLFKESKLQNALQISCKPSNKWAMICIDLKNLLNEYFGERVVHKELKSLTLCANMSVRGAYTSDILYSPKTLPKEIMMRAVKVEEWGKFFDWIHVPEIFGNENIEKEEKNEEKSEKKEEKSEKKEEKGEKKEERRGKKEEVKKKNYVKEEYKLKKIKPEDVKEDFAKEAPIIATPVPQKKESKPVKSKPATKMIKPEPLAEENPIEVNDKKTLYPDPIIELASILHNSPSPYSILWAPSEYFTSYPSPFKDSSSKFIFYPSNCTIICLNPTNLAKNFFFAHNRPVTQLHLHKTFLVSVDSSCLLLFWPIKTRKQPVPLPMKKFASITSLALTDTKMAVSGKDELNRDLILLYDISSLGKKRQIVQITQQLSDFDVKIVKLFEDNRMISCGKDNIRIWTLKDDRMVGLSLAIGSKDQHCYSDIEISGKKAYVTSSVGSVLVINLISKEFEASYMIHKGPITRIKIVEDVVMTAGEDFYSRLWPLDFHELYMEVQHKSKVTSIDILGNNAATLTETGVLLSIDLSQSTFLTLMRSFPHVVSFSITSSLIAIINNYISVVNQEFQPVCEFNSPKDEPTVSSINQTAQILACGFDSGAVRLFDLVNFRILQEFLHLKAAIEVIQFSRDGKLMFCIAEDGNYSVFTGSHSFEPVKDGRIEIPSIFCASFSTDSKYLAFVTNYSSSIALFTTSPLCQKFRLNSSQPYQGLSFTRNRLLALTQEPCKMIYYQLLDSAVSLSKEILLPKPIQNFTVSSDSNFIACSSEDLSIRIYDFWFTACQAFLGHSAPIKQIVWEGSRIFTLAEGDGVLVWDFKGEIGKVVEVIQVEEEAEEIEEESEEALEVDIQREVEEYLRHVESIQANVLLKAQPSMKYMFGYSPIADNVQWVPEKSCLLYSLGSLVVKTLLVGEKKQIVMQDHYNNISALAVSPDHSLIATAEGLATFSGAAKINIWNLDTCKLSKVLEQREKSITSLQFSPCGQYLCSLSNSEECLLIVWELLTSRAVSTSVLKSGALCLKWLPSISVLEFSTLSSTGVYFWRLNSLKHLEFQPGESGSEDLSCMDFTPYFEDVSGHFLVTASSKGSVFVTNARTNSMVFSKKLMEVAINSVCCKERCVLIGGECAEVYMWRWEDGLFCGAGVKVLCDGIPLSLSFNSLGTEGIVATSNGSIWYIEWENGSVRVLSSHFKSISALGAGEFIASAGADFSIRIWNPRTLEQDTHILVPNCKCLCLTFHSTLPYLIAGFDDGSLKAFEIISSKCLGSSRSSLTSITALEFSLENDCLVLGTITGVVIGVTITKWAPFTVDFFEFTNIGSEVLAVDCKSKGILVSTIDGVLKVWEQKYAPESSSKLFQGNNEFNLIDIFDFKEPHERTKHVYSQADSLECKAKFDKISEKMLWVIVRGAQYILYRNYYSHQIVRKVNLAGFPMCISVFEHKVAVGLADRRVLVYFDGNVHEFLSHSEPVSSIVLFKEGLVTAASNEIALWDL